MLFRSPYLRGEELNQQMRRVQQLINTANRQQRETEATASKGHPGPPPGYDAAGKAKPGVEASSTSRGRTKDKHPRAHRERSASSQPRDQGPKPAGRTEGGNRHESRAGRSVKERVGHKVTIDERLGPLGPENSADARIRLDKLKLSSIIEEEDIAAHHCFGPRIRSEREGTSFWAGYSSEVVASSVRSPGEILTNGCCEVVPCRKFSLTGLDS